jgi:hypothetical protein
MKKKKKYHTVGTIPKSNIQIGVSGKIDIPRTHSWLGTGTSIKSGRIN